MSDLFCPHGRTAAKCTACSGSYSVNGRSLAHPGRNAELWRGWRDTQPKRNPVTVKRLPPGDAR